MVTSSGRQVELADFPVNIAVDPSGRFAAVLHSGYSEHQILVVDIAAAQVVSRVSLPESFYGLAFSRDGKKLVCSGAGEEIVNLYDFDQGRLSNHIKVKLRDPKKTGVPAGLALDRNAAHVYVANVWGDSVTRAALQGAPQPLEILLGTNGIGGWEAPAKPSVDFDTAAAEKRRQAALYGKGAAGSFPYACCLDEARSAFTSASGRGPRWR